MSGSRKAVVKSTRPRKAWVGILESRFKLQGKARKEAAGEIPGGMDELNAGLVRKMDDYLYSRLYIVCQVLML